MASCTSSFCAMASDGRHFLQYSLRPVEDRIVDEFAVELDRSTARGFRDPPHTLAGSLLTRRWREVDSNHRSRDLPKKVKLMCKELLVFQEPIVCRLTAGGRWLRTFGSRTHHPAVRPSRGRFPVIGSSPHWPGGTGISNLRFPSRVDLCVRTRTVSGT